MLPTSRPMKQYFCTLAPPMTDFSQPQLDCLEQALVSSKAKTQLLQQQELLNQILDSSIACRWLHEQIIHPDDRRRIKARSLLILILQKSGAITARRSDITLDDHEEALARSWAEFTHRLEKYDPDKASYRNWFNFILKRRIIDVQTQRRQEEHRRISPPSDAQESDLFERIIANDSTPETAILEGRIYLEQIAAAVQADRSLSACQMQHYPFVTCQRLMLKVLEQYQKRSDLPWSQIAAEFKVPERSLREFYINTALPAFKRFCRQHRLI